MLNPRYMIFIQGPFQKNTVEVGETFRILEQSTLHLRLMLKFVVPFFPFWPSEKNWFWPV